MQELAKMGHFDKGTVTKAVQKLIEQGYIRRETDEKDKRLCHLYTTQKALPFVENTYQIRDKWNDILTQQMTSEEKEQAEELLTRMAENAHRSMNTKKVDEN